MSKEPHKLLRACWSDPLSQSYNKLNKQNAIRNLHVRSSYSILLLFKQPSLSLNSVVYVCVLVHALTRSLRLSSFYILFSSSSSPPPLLLLAPINRNPEIGISFKYPANRGSSLLVSKKESFVHLILPDEHKKDVLMKMTIDYAKELYPDLYDQRFTDNMVDQIIFKEAPMDLTEE